MARSGKTLWEDQRVYDFVYGSRKGINFATLRGRLARYSYDDRTIERALQRLRKAGKITYTGGADRLWRAL